MSNIEFKVDDLVYYPAMSNKLLKVTPRLDSYFPLFIVYEAGRDSFTRNGCLYKDGIAPSIFHATQENYELLCKLYPNVEFEPPPKRKEPKEIIKAMLESGWVGVACYVNDIDKRPSKYNKKDLIVLVKDDSFEHIYSGNYCNWKYANPFDPKTGKTIIDFVDDEVVLED